MQTALRAALAAYRERDARARRAIFSSIFRRSARRARPCPRTRARPGCVYTMLRGRCHAPHPI